MSADFTPEKEDLKILTPFKMQVLTNFPYIEADFDALTNYQLLCKVVEYLNNVITNENEVSEQVTSLYNAYVALQNYVNTYFDNLDLEAEVSAKLDEMASDGSLTILLKQYIDPLYQAYETSINNEISLFKSTVNAQIEDIENLVDSATSGSPAGVYPTVVDLAAADPDHSKIYLVTADGKWYYYSTSSSDWVAGGVYQSSSVSESDPVITEINHQIDKIEDMLEQKNLFDNSTRNGQVTSGGNVTDAEGSVRTDYNKCESETDYTLSWLSDTTYPVYVGYFDNSKTFISRVFYGNKRTHTPITTPANCKYFIPFWSGASLENIANVQIELGDEMTPYEPPHFNVKTNRVIGLPDLIEEVEEIKNDINTNVKILPDYYIQELNTVKTEVLNNIGINSLLFGLYTDIHFNTPTSSEYPANIREMNAMRSLADQLPLYYTLNGGDTLTYSTKAFSIEMINKDMNTFSGCRCPHFISKGDHDSAQSDTKLTKEDFAKLTYPYMKNIVKCPTVYSNYYYDIPELKTRFINIESGSAMSGEGTSDLEKVYTWLINDVFTDDVKNGWNFVIFGHAPFDYEWNVGMVRMGSFGAVRQTQVMMIDLANAINTAGIFTKTSGPAYSKTFYYDIYGVLTQNTTGEPLTVNMGPLGTSYYKDFSGWTSKVKLLVSGHCHCDRLNKVTNGITYDFGIAYTAAAQYGGFKNEQTYYYPCFGEEGRIAYWNDIENRSVGNITEALMDIYMINNNNIKKIRFGIGNNLELNL